MVCKPLCDYNDCCGSKRLLLLINPSNSRSSLSIFAAVFAIVDIEGSGGSPKTSRITEVAVVVHNGKRVIEEFSSLVNPQEPIDPFVVALTGISDEMVDDAPTFEEISDELLKLTDQRILVAHNSRFDYGLLKNEFKRIGKRFQRRTICTVKMSRKLLPGHSSYSLGNLCDDLNIPIKNRHRALGDASATAVLLEKLLFTEKKGLLEDLLKSELETANLPTKLIKQEVDDLPEETGVYYFLNEKGQPIYIGKSTNIRKRILSHFTSDSNSKRFHKLKEEVAAIDYQLTGSELIAEIVECGEIKRFMPKHNRAQKRKKYRFGVFLEKDENNYYRLTTKLLHPDREPVLHFTRKKWAKEAIQELRKKYNLTQEQRVAHSDGEYNDLVLNAISNFNFQHPNCFIIDEGRHFDEKAVISIREGSYFGHEFIDTYILENESVERLLEHIPKDYHHPEKERIIRKHLRKNKKRLKVVHYNAELLYN